MAIYENLKNIIEQHSILYKAFLTAGIGKSQMSRIINHDQWPVKADRATLQADIEAVLATNGVSKQKLAKIWESPLAVKRTTHLLQGGPAVLEKHILEQVGLNRDPFWNEISGVEDVFDSKPHLYIFNKMYDAAQNAKFIGIHGPVGSGKTIVKNLLIERLQSEHNFLISEPLISEKSRLRPPSIADPMIQDFLYQFGSIQQSGKLSSPRSLEAKVRFLARILKNNQKLGRRCVIIIDEAHDIPIETIKSMKRFHEIQDGFKKLLGIILIGQPELHDIITRDYRIREVAARVDMVEIKPQAIDAGEYLSWKIQRAGGAVEKLFNEAALTEIRRKLNGSGSPLLINVIASHTIKKAYATNNLPATAEVVELAFKEMGG